MDDAEDPAGGPNGSPAWDLQALDQYPPPTLKYGSTESVPVNTRRADAT
jgi:hypothetical protein